MVPTKRMNFAAFTHGSIPTIANPLVNLYTVGRYSVTNQWDVNF